MDPLEALPAEIVLRLLDFSPIASIANLTQANQAWHNFIEHLHQDAIYASPRKTEHPPESKEFSFLKNVESFDQYFKDTSSWRDLCKRQTLLRRNYHDPNPTITESFMVPLSEQKRVWRFRTDLRRRFFICTSQDGGLQVTDVDGKGRLWHLPHNEVPPFAHLEYEDGVAVWSTLGDALEVWKTDEPGLSRGTFRKVAVLDCPMHHLRGFHLAYQTLCVVGDDGRGLVYDLSTEPPRLRTRLNIQEGAVGHLCQGEDVVMYSMGHDGFHIHDKTSGALLGAIDPRNCADFYHIAHPTRPALDITGTNRRSIQPLSSYTLHTEEPNDISIPIAVEPGPLSSSSTDPHEPRTTLDADTWGSGLLSGNLMVGISQAGRVVVCSNWREALKSDEAFRSHTAIIECEDNEENFILGGWLSIRDNRILFEILDKVYFVSLDEEGRVVTGEEGNRRPSWCFFSALNLMLQRRLQSGISMMQLFDDCIITTCGVSCCQQMRCCGRVGS